MQTFDEVGRGRNAPKQAVGSRVATEEAARDGQPKALGTASPLVNGMLLLVGYIANWLPFVLVEVCSHPQLPCFMHGIIAPAVTEFMSTR